MFLTKRLLIIITILFQAKAYGYPVTKGLIIYSYVQKNKPFVNLSGFDLKQPDSVYYSVFFDNKFSVTYFSPAIAKLYPAEYSFSSFDQYSYNYIDSGFYIKKLQLCNSLYKLPFLKKELYSSSETQIISGINCSKYYSLNSFGDTTFFFATNEFPKSAGIKIFENFDKCILGISTSQFNLFPATIDKTVTYDINKLNTSNPEVIKIQSANYNWIESPVSEIKQGSPFPKFIAKSINGISVNEQIFKDSTKDCSIILLLNNIKFCKSYSPELKGYYKDADEQSIQLVESLNKTAADQNQQFLIFTGDFRENINGLKYSNLLIIPNALEWFEKMKIYQFPLFVIVNNKGIVIDFLSLFDLTGKGSYYDSFKMLINDCKKL